MVPRNNPKAICSPGEEDVAPDSQNQQRARPCLARSRRRRCRQKTSESQNGDEPRVLQVYKFKSRAPSISVHCNGRDSSGLSRTPVLPKDGNIVEMLARSASYWLHQEPARCWVRDCNCLAAGPPSRRHLLQHDVLGEEDSLTSLIRQESFSMHEVHDGSTGDTGTASSQAGVQSANGPRSFAEEYSLVPLSRRDMYSAQSFDQQVERYFERF